MPTFSTSEPISTLLPLFVGDAYTTADGLDETVVEARPGDQSKAPGVRTTEQTSVEYTGGRLLVQTPKRRSNMIGLGFVKDVSVQVRIELPHGSRIHGSTG
ncbi:hypothetical protein [Actinomadura macra]|uniref:hypothetical protein n=1 Tax=Actinomadura macra TaxID=46164 RepID=UPI00082B9E68|nr:hypothetical protein [Actinomadura macra]